MWKVARQSQKKIDDSSKLTRSQTETRINHDPKETNSKE